MVSSAAPRAMARRGTFTAQLRTAQVMPKTPIYKVIFHNNNQVYELYARAIYQSDMYGFIEVEEYIFNKDKQLVVDPSSEKLKNEFSKVERSYIPINSIIRIDEVNESGEAKIKENKGQVSPFPLNIQPSNKKDWFSQA